MKPNNAIALVLLMMFILVYIFYYVGGFLFRRYLLWVRPNDLEQAAQAAPGRAPSPSSSRDFSLNVLDVNPVGIDQWAANVPLEDIAEEEPELAEEEAAEPGWPEGHAAEQEWLEGEGAGQELPEGVEAGQELQEVDVAEQEWEEEEEEVPRWAEGPPGAGPAAGVPLVGLDIYLE